MLKRWRQWNSCPPNRGRGQRALPRAQVTVFINIQIATAPRHIWQPCQYLNLVIVWFAKVVGVNFVCTSRRLTELSFVIFELRIQNNNNNDNNNNNNIRIDFRVATTCCATLHQCTISAWICERRFRIGLFTTGLNSEQCEINSVGMVPRCPVAD